MQTTLSAIAVVRRLSTPLMRRGQRSLVGTLRKAVRGSRPWGDCRRLAGGAGLMGNEGLSWGLPMCEPPRCGMPPELNEPGLGPGCGGGELRRRTGRPI